MLTEKSESKSIRVNSVNENGEEVLSANASYSLQSINISFDMINKNYCASHKEEVQDAMTAFLMRLNAALSEDGFPVVESE